jgi:menaquinone-dependent protoporphyrinogen oxidase
MKTLILYATKHGCTEMLARRLSDRLGGATLSNLKANSHPPLSAFDCVLLGSAVYAGTAPKELKTFVSAHADELKTKRLGLFMSGLSQSGAEQFFNGNFPKALVDAAVAKSFLGGAFDKDSARWFEKLVMRIVRKSSESFTLIEENNMTAFIKAVSQPKSISPPQSGGV